MPNANKGEMIATTIANYGPTLADNVMEQNALLRFLKENDGIHLTGGSPIYEPIIFGENGNAGSYSGYDELPTAQYQSADVAEFPLALYSCPVAFSHEEELKNSGKQRMHDLLRAKIKQAEFTIANLFNRHLYLDGTGNGGKNLIGLAAAVSFTPTNVYGNIDRNVAANAFWKNKTFRASTDGGGVATSATIRQQWSKFWQSLKFGADEPNVIIASTAVFSLYEDSLMSIQRTMETGTVNSGMKALEFKGRPVFADASASGIAATDAYFLNTKYLKFRPHEKDNFSTTDDVTSINQNATVRQITWAGNLTCAGSRYQGIYRNT